MAKTVVGLFSTIAEANTVKTALVAKGFEAQHITVVANDGDDTMNDVSTSETTTGTAAEATSGTGIGSKISNFFGGLTGGDKDVHHHYASGINEGGGLLAVTCPDEQAYEVAALLKQHGARDIDGAFEGSAEAGVPVYGGGAAASTTGETIPVVEEELVVGKREVDRGGVRVYSHVVETPVSADVTLRDEFINVERRPVSRIATAADFEAGRGSTIELNATGEEAVVGKTARVVEEVVVGKQSTQRTEAIHDSVRKTEVEVEQVGATTTGYTTDTTTTGTKTTL